MPSLPRIVRRLLGGADHRVEHLASSSLEGQEDRKCKGARALGSRSALAVSGVCGETFSIVPWAKFERAAPCRLDIEFSATGRVAEYAYGTPAAGAPADRFSVPVTAVLR